MVKRGLLALLFVAAVGFASVALTSTAQAGHGCGYGGYGYRSYYPSYSPYFVDYGPRVSYYRSYGHRGHHGHRGRHGHYGHHGHHDYGHAHFSFGF